jgi:FSR family fosmidomycin resistance protein-like MFS transporter
LASASATVAVAIPRFQKATLSILFAISCSHLINDVMQSLMASLYPLFKQNYSLNFLEIGLITLTFQVTYSRLSVS